MFGNLGGRITEPQVFWNEFGNDQRKPRRLWRSQRRKSRSVSEGGADFPAAVSLPENAQTSAGVASGAAGKSTKNVPAAPNFAGKLFQQGISDSHSLLEFSEMILCVMPCPSFPCVLGIPCSFSPARNSLSI